MSWRVTLVPLPAAAGDAPAMVRLRKALKALLRRYRLRCTLIAEIEAQPVTEANR